MTGEPKKPARPVVGHLKKVVRGEEENPPAQATTQPVALGQFGRYRLVRVLGQGGGGVVYEAVDTRLNRPIALKKIVGSTLPQNRKRFLREARMAAQLRHPNIVGVYDAGERDGHLFLTMELIQGSTLDRARSRLSRKRILEIVWKIARALAYAHKKGVIHRDIKPGNILLDQEGKPYLADFGLARDLHPDARLTESGISVGTPSYMSPEQALGAAGVVDTRTDLYSLGVVLYEMVTGKLPHDGPNLYEQLRSILQDDPPAPRSLDPSVDPDLEAVILRAIEKNKDRRYSTAESFAEDLGRVLQGKEVTARKGGTLRWIRRRRKRIALLAGGASVLVLGGILIAVGRSGDRDEAGVVAEMAAPFVEPKADRTSVETLLGRAEKLSQDLPAYRRKGDTARIGETFREIERILNEALKHDPKSGEVHEALARCYSSDRRYAESARAYAKARAFGWVPRIREMALAQETRARVMAVMTETLPSREGFDPRRLAGQDGWKEFLSDLASAAKNPRSVSGPLQTALLKAASGEVSAAYRAVKEIVRGEKETLSLGRPLYALLARKREELPVLSMGPALRDMVAIQAAWAWYYIRQGKYSSAKGRLRSLKVSPDTAPPSVSYLLAHCHLSEGDARGALDLLGRCTPAREDVHRVEYLRGICLLVSKAKGAEEAFRRVAATHASLAENQYHWGVALATRGDHRGALDRLSRAMSSAQVRGASVRNPADRSLLVFRVSRDLVREDPLLKGLREDPEFGRALLRLAGH